MNGCRTAKAVVTKTYETFLVHNYVTTVVAATCTEDGYTLHTCVCGYSYRDNVVAKLGHSYVQVSDHMTYIVYRCTRCGTFYNSPVITIPVDRIPQFRCIA